MVSKKSTRGTVSKVSSSAAPATVSSTQSATSSSILRSAFSPSKYQLSLFASVIQGLESQHLRIHDTATGRLRCEHAVALRATISCLDWGYFGSRHHDGHEQSAKKKRKRNEQTNGFSDELDNSDICIAFGTSDSNIRMFSPLEGRIVGELKGVQDEHERGVRDFKFTNMRPSAEGWSLGNGDGKLVQWDLRNGSSLKVVSVPTICATLARPVPTNPPVICASHAAYIINPESKEASQSSPFPASTNLVHTLITSSPTSTKLSPRFLTAAESDRSMSVFDAKEGKLVGSLVAQNNVQRLAFSSDAAQDDLDHTSQSRQAVAALTEEGVVELFPAPFQSFGTITNDTTSVKSKRKQMTRKAHGLVKVVRPDNLAAAVPLVDIAFQDNDLLMVWTEGGVGLVFERIRWRDQDSGDLLWSGTKEIVTGRSSSTVTAAFMNGVKDMSKSQVDESHAVVTSGGDAEDVQMALEERAVIDISSSEEDSDIEDVSASETGVRDREPEPVEATDEKVVDAQDPDDEHSEKAEEPSFGDLLLANAPEIVDVVATFDNANPHALTKTGERSVQLPSGMSLGTVLTQSLRTNDVNLLETCFHVLDLNTVRGTIERLDSSLSAALLQKLAERLHSRPGRAGRLMVWVQWTLVAHGGYLASQPEVMKKLSSLHRVVKERANSLQSLLSLKGKLDMLEAQMNLRKAMQTRSRSGKSIDEDDEDDEEGVIYVEGQEESDSEDEEMEDAAAIEARIPRRTSGGAKPRAFEDEQSEDEDSGNEMPATMNGATADSEDEGSENGEDGFIDDEASETDTESGDEGSGDDINHDDVDSINDDDESEPEAPPSKRAAKMKLSNGLFPKKI